MKKREDSFWGIHCDYHAQPWMGSVGRTLDPEEIKKVCRELQIDFWQIDCKGHFGYTTYPTKFGNAMPEFSCDNLEVWRRATREENVALYMHYSGVVDEKYGKEHPDECFVKADGTRPAGYIAMYPKSSYYDNLLIPQLSELAEKYQVDGIWLDGECWGYTMDYHKDILEDFFNETGIDIRENPPTKPEDEHYHEYKDYMRELFRRNLRKVVDTLHEKHPDLQIASNWAFSIHMPEKVSADVDFLSGDNMPSDSLNSMRYVARYMPQQNKPWDIMGMGQNWGGACRNLDLLPLHATQVMQQAAIVISLGGAFQVGITQLFDNSPDTQKLLNLKEVGKFLREREEFCFKGKIIPQAAMFLSKYDRYHENWDRIYPLGVLGPKYGMSALLCEAGQSFEIVSEHSIEENIERFKMICVPETVTDLDEESINKLLTYAKNGGNLLLVGSVTNRIFSKYDVPFNIGEIEDNIPEGRFLGQQSHPKDLRLWSCVGSDVVSGVSQPVRILAKGDGEVVAELYYSTKTERHPFAQIMPYGKGKIAAVGANIGGAYAISAQPQHVKLIKNICEKLYAPLARIESALGSVEIVCLEKNDRLMLQLINTNGPHGNANCATYDFIPPALDIKMSVATCKKPKKLILQPEGKKLKFKYKDGRVYFDIDRLYIHNIVEFVM